MAQLPLNFLPHTRPIPESSKNQLRRLAAEAEAYKNGERKKVRE